MVKSNATTWSVGTLRKEAVDWKWQCSIPESVLSFKTVHLCINPGNFFFYSILFDLKIYLFCYDRYVEGIEVNSSLFRCGLYALNLPLSLIVCTVILPHV